MSQDSTPLHSPSAEPLNKNVLAYADAWLKWKTKPRHENDLVPNPADYDLTAEQGQLVIDHCIRAIEECAVEKATKHASP